MRALFVTAVAMTSIVFISACGAPEPAADAPADTPAAAAAPASAPTTPEAKVASAMSAGPPEIAQQATIMDMDAAGAMTELRAGTNGWMCMPDIGTTPGTDPICVDQAWQQWFGAYLAKTPPQLSGVGIAYMLQGGSDASNTDPFATQPAAGADWIDSGPHVMVVPPNTAMLDAFGTDFNTGGPWVMWKGTPYAHLMVPVADRP
jgi:hypothetical protein